MRHDQATADNGMKARAATAKRFEDWAYIERSKALSPTDELSVVVVPSQLDRTFDMRCLVYKNSALEQVSFQCPEATQAQLADIIERLGIGSAGLVTGGASFACTLSTGVAACNRTQQRWTAQI